MIANMASSFFVGCCEKQLSQILQKKRRQTPGSPPGPRPRHQRHILQPQVESLGKLIPLEDEPVPLAFAGHPVLTQDVEQADAFVQIVQGVWYSGYHGVLLLAVEYL